MKAIIQAYSPKEIERIARGEQTVKVCKTAPKLETPFKVYVYCTKERMTRVPSMYAYLHKNEPGACAEYGTIETWGKIGDVIVNPHLASKHVSFGMHGKVIGSFVCDKVYKIVPDGEYYSNGYDIDDDMLSETCLGRGYLTGYGLGYTLYGWHITGAKLYDKPKELSEFYTLGNCEKYDFCNQCKNFHRGQGWLDGSYCDEDSCLDNTRIPVTRPPQSWMYVEELQ